jgi:hypothetical protein
MVQNSTACSGTGKAPEHRYKRFLIFTILALALFSLLQAQNIIKSRGKNEGRHDRRNKLSDLGCFPRHVPLHAIPGFRYGAICSLAPSLQPVRAIVAQNDAAAHSPALPSREDTAQVLPGTCLISRHIGPVTYPASQFRNNVGGHVAATTLCKRTLRRTGLRGSETLKYESDEPEGEASGRPTADLDGGLGSSLLFADRLKMVQ